MNLNALKMFVHIVQAGSLTAATEKLGVSLPTLSRKMNELEQQLNVQLLERSTLGVRLTHAGQQLYEDVRLSIEHLSESRWKLQHQQQQLEGSLRFSLPPNFDWWWDGLIAFQQQHPNVQIFCHSGTQLVDLIDDSIDFAVRLGDLHTDTLVAKPMGKLRRMLVASPEFIAQYGKPLQPSELVNFPLASYGSLADSINNRVQWQLGEQTVAVKTQFLANNSHVLCRYALAGMAVVQLPSHLAIPLIEQGRLVEILADFPSPEQTIHLLYPHRRYPSNLMRAFLDFCQQKPLISYLK